MGEEEVSFTVRRPTPPSRTASSGPDSDNPSFKTPALPRHLTAANDSLSGSPLARSAASSPGGTYYQHESDSSDEDDDQLQDQLLTSFDQFAVQRSSKKRKSDNGPLVIPALQNKDWRAVARKRRSAAQRDKDGSVGGLGTKDTINSGPVLAGLQIKSKASIKIEAEQHIGTETREIIKMEVEETEDQRALRAILAAAEGIETDDSNIRVIPTPVSEAEALKQDIEELPDVATLDDYTRVPVSQFGAAMLRGMGWSDGSAKGGKHVEPYLPQARPALLGIGAKEKEALDDGSAKKKRNGRPERRYVPVVKKERENAEGSGSEKREASPSSRQSGSKSRRSSRSPSRRKDWNRDDRRDDHPHESDRDRQDRRYDGSQDRERDGYRERYRDRNREKRYRGG
ncbi:DExH-box splicing factor binding site-domain-containing protein [Amanita rubescens]|nr:DExH-box splicing factor binding site-domain-containing protein [Amanita rubescens]